MDQERWQNVEYQSVLEQARKHSEGTHYIQGVRTTRDRKMTTLALEHESAIRILVFPKKEHEAEFKQSALLVDDESPAHIAPEAIGSAFLKTVAIRLLTTRTIKMPNGTRPSSHVLSLEYIQAHTKTAVGKFPPIRRTRSHYYGGWRRRVLHEALIAAAKQNIPLCIHKKEQGMDWLLRDPQTDQKRPFRKELEEISLEKGFEIHENEHYLTVQLSQQQPGKKAQEQPTEQNPTTAQSEIVKGNFLKRE